MKELKFRVWDSYKKRWMLFIEPIDEFEECEMTPEPAFNSLIIEQYTGLKDKNGKEIYVNCELDGRYIVEYIAPSFVGRDMINGDIIELYDNKFTITKEHSEIPQNSERGIN